MWLAALLLAYPLGYAIVTRGFGTSWTIDAYNAVFLAAALLLHGRPAPFLRACRAGVDSAWGIILQFPFYAGIFGLMQNTGPRGLDRRPLRAPSPARPAIRWWSTSTRA